eukprot:SAG22_NODE_8449_length_655_cov_0.973022_1_plen_110_part_00
MAPWPPAGEPETGPGQLEGAAAGPGNAAPAPSSSSGPGKKLAGKKKLSMGSIFRRGVTAALAVDIMDSGAKDKRARTAREAENSHLLNSVQRRISSLAADNPLSVKVPK